MKTTLDVAESVQILLDSDIVTKEMIDSWGEPNYHGIVEGIDLRNFGYGDYWGSDYDRSNVRALVRDFPEFLSQWGRPNTGVRLSLDWGAFIDPTNEEPALDLAQALAGVVCDYPLYDESDHSELESEMITEAWCSYGADDLSKAIEETYDIDLNRFSFDSVLCDIFVEAYASVRCGEWGCAETATSWVWPDMTKPYVLSAVMDGIAQAFLEERPAISEGQLTLFV